jgi:alcohol dehydrogenase (NADP+)
MQQHGGPGISAGDSVDPALVPRRTLSSGATMPAIGLGTFGSDHVSAAEVAEVVKGAAAAGYRHFDCASVYRNEAESAHRLKRFSAAELGAKTFGSPPSSGTTSTAKTT